MSQKQANKKPRTSGASRQKPKANSKKSTTKSNIQFWFGCGFVVGVIATLSVQNYLTPKAEVNSQYSVDTNNAASSLPAEEEAPLEFEFFDLLRESEVSVDTSDIHVSAPSEYLLQAGSFRKADDAESLRVQILLLNYEAQVKAIDSQGQIWHRVTVGPFSDRSTLAKARKTLLENNIKSLTLKRPKP